MVTLLAPTLRRVARRYESDAQSSRDLQQEMLIALWLSLDSFEGNSSFGTWVNGVAHRVGTEHVAERRQDLQARPLSADVEGLPSPHDPESIFETRERALALLSSLDGLRRREREVVLLHLQEFELDEMSLAMKICRTQVRETLIRARRRLMVRMRKAELRSIAVFDRQATDAAGNEPNPGRATRRRRTRHGDEQDGIYFIAPVSTKVGADGRA